MAHVLIVDDEPQIARMLNTVLSAHGYRVTLCSDGLSAIEKTALLQPDVLLLDLGLPYLNGMDVIRRIREWSHVPIIVLTVHDAEAQKVAALDLGADDYLTKPFSMAELSARLRVALRNVAWRKNTTDAVLIFDQLQIDRARRLVSCDGKEVKLTPTEYELLLLLAGNAGKVLTHMNLLRNIWGPGATDDLPTLRVFINQLRKKIEPNPSQPMYIRTEPGIGYRFVSPDPEK